MKYKNSLITFANGKRLFWILLGALNVVGFILETQSQHVFYAYVGLAMVVWAAFSNAAQVTDSQ